MSWRFPVIVLVSLLGLLLWQRHTIHIQSRQLGEVIAANAGLNASLQTLEDERRRIEAALLAREEARHAIDTERAKERRTSAAATVDDAQFSAWGATPLPDAALGLLEKPRADCADEPAGSAVRIDEGNSGTVAD